MAIFSYLSSVVAQGLWNMPIETDTEKNRALCALQLGAVTFLFTTCRYIIFLNFFFTFVKGMRQQIASNNRKVNTRLCFFCEIWNMASICQTELQRVWVSARAQTNRPATLLIDKRLRSVPVSPLLLPPEGTERTGTFQTRGKLQSHECVHLHFACKIALISGIKRVNKQFDKHKALGHYLANGC